MTNKGKFAPVVFDDSIQETEIKPLKRWVRLVSRRPDKIPMCQVIAKLIELDLLKYGTWAASFGSKNAFAAVRHSAEVQSFIDEVFRKRHFAEILLGLFSQGRLLMEAGCRPGHADFIFFSADTALDVIN